MKIKNIAILCGGFSGEWDISLQSGNIVEKHLDRKHYNPYRIIISREGWYHEDLHGGRSAIDKEDFSLVLEGKRIYFDAVFNAIHGTPGEDGKIQGYLDMLGVPYTGCDHAVSALTFNKKLCKDFVGFHGVSTARGILFRKGDDLDYEAIPDELGLPVFVKPNNGGSSVGTSRVNERQHIRRAISEAHAEDSEVLIESFIRGREITCGVLRHGKQMIILPVTEIISRKEFFDFEAKYDPSLAQEIVPADIPPDTRDHCMETSGMLFRELGCRGVVRFDYIFNDDGLFFLEVNTIPGLTEASIVPKMAACHGINLKKLFSMILDDASLSSRMK